MSNEDRTFNPHKAKNFGQGQAGIPDEARRGRVNEAPVRNDHLPRRADDSRPAGDGDARGERGAQSSSSDQRA